LTDQKKMPRRTLSKLAPGKFLTGSGYSPIDNQKFKACFDLCIPLLLSDLLLARIPISSASLNDQESRRGHPADRGFDDGRIHRELAGVARCVRQRDLSGDYIAFELECGRKRALACVFAGSRQFDSDRLGGTCLHHPVGREPAHGDVPGPT
jgi:hypothetical protein